MLNKRFCCELEFSLLNVLLAAERMPWVYVWNALVFSGSCGLAFVSAQSSQLVRDRECTSTVDGVSEIRR